MLLGVVATTAVMVSAASTPPQLPQVSLGPTYGAVIKQAFLSYAGTVYPQMAMSSRILRAGSAAWALLRKLAVQASSTTRYTLHFTGRSDVEFSRAAS